MKSDPAMAAQSDVARARVWVAEARESDRLASAAAAARGEPAPEAVEPKMVAVLAVYERMAVAHSRVTALRETNAARGAEIDAAAARVADLIEKEQPDGRA